jgi:hypothetical protein
MICFKNLASLATLTSTGTTAINTTEAATLKRALKDGFCTFPAASDKTLRAVFAADQNVSVFAMLGVVCLDDISGYDPNFISASTLVNKQLDQDLRARAHQTENFVAVYAAAQTGDTFDLELSVTSSAVYARQLWIGDGVRNLPGINMQRVSLGGAEIVQLTSGATFVSARPSWRKYSVTLPYVTNEQWHDAGGLIELESSGNGTEALIMPGGVSSDSARVGLLAVHGVITNFSAQQIKRGVRAVTFEITECR